jgi:hypothetical protein
VSIFKNFSASTIWVSRILVVAIVVDIIAVLSGLAELYLLSRIESGSYDYDLAAAAESNGRRQKAIGLVQLVLWLLCAVAILAWIRLANKNARLLGARDMEFTPGWAIGWYFIPIANLWKPYQAMVEIWRASSGSADWKSDETSGSLPGWWFAWLAFNVLGQMSFQRTVKAQEILELKNAAIATIAADVASMVLCILFLEIVKDIHHRQMAWSASPNPQSHDTSGLAATDTV